MMAPMSASRSLRIAYVTTYDSRDVHCWSGSGFHIAQALEQQGQTVLRIGPLEEHPSWWTRQRQRIERRLFGRYHPLDRQPEVLDSYAKQVQHQLTSLAADVVLSPGIIPVAHLPPGLPLVTWTDATFANVVDAYPEFSGLSPQAVQQGHDSERAALRRASFSLFTSRWAAERAITSYGANPARVAVVPFGANSDTPLAANHVESVALRRLEQIRLLFIGVDWQRKGGPAMLDVVRHLRAAGCAARLIVIGCTPEIPHDLADAVEVLGFISKHEEAGRARLASEFSHATLLCLLSNHECFGLVLCEACAQALPCLTTDAEGIPTIIQDGVNGLANAPGTDPAVIARQVLTLLQDRPRYLALSRAALSSYERDFNWSVAGARVMEFLRKAVAAVPRAQ